MRDAYFAFGFWWWHIDSNTDEDVSGDDSDYEAPNGLKEPKPKKKKMRKKPDSKLVTMDLKRIFKNITDAAYQVKFSTAVHLEFMCFFVNQCTDAYTADITASLSICKQQSGNRIKEMAEKIRTRLTAPLYPTVHFDRKVVKHGSGESFDHEAVCLPLSTEIDHPPFLGAPELDPPTSEYTARVVINMLEAWSIDINSLYATVWDTTAVVTMVLVLLTMGACTCIEREKGTALLWCACCHHIEEVHITHVFTAIRGPNTGKMLVIPFYFCDINVSN